MAALRTKLRLLARHEIRISDDFERLIEHRFVIAAVIFERLEILVDDLVPVGKRIRRNEIAAPNLGGIDLQFVRGEIKQALHHEYAVLAPSPAVGRHDRQVGKDCRERAVIGRYDVRAEQGALAVDWYGQAVGIIRATVMQEDILDAENATVACDGYLRIVDLTALMGGRKEVLQPVFDPFHRTIDPHGYPGQHDLFGVKHHDLGTETTADKGRDDTHLAFAKPKHGGKAVADKNWRLGRIPDRHLTGAIVPMRHHAARFDRRGDAVLISKAALEDQVRLGGSAVIIALSLVDMRRNVGTEIVMNM